MEKWKQSKKRKLRKGYEWMEKYIKKCEFGKGYEWMEKHEWMVFESKDGGHRHVISIPQNDVFHHLIFVKDKNGYEELKLNNETEHIVY